MRVTIVVLILSVAVLGQNPSPKQAASVPRNAQQSDSPKAPIPPPALQPAPAEPPPQPEPTASNPPRAAAEPKESFSELTLFLFGSGFALFIALLGWSDRIRGIDKDTREMERLFMEDSGIHKRQFRCIVKPESPDQELEVLTELVNAGKIKTVDTVRLVRPSPTGNANGRRSKSFPSGGITSPSCSRSPCLPAGPPHYSQLQLG